MKKTTKKLSIKKETVRVFATLSAQEENQIVGGFMAKPENLITCGQEICMLSKIQSYCCDDQM